MGKDNIKNNKNNPLSEEEKGKISERRAITYARKDCFLKGKRIGRKRRTDSHRSSVLSFQSGRSPVSPPAFLRLP